ncbi:MULTISPECIES: hypothetical protein [Streptomycetaceae]|uniref:hypothetical protein n=1 Tax=Streptomycetaceae TaxID=2062 RepID=UPI000CDC51AC|nr:MULTISPECIES: hypothetical protein [Streptomycetaceae]AUY50889.1 hypothetical protein C2142_20265 [Streptomyces sp. CB01881]MBP0454545.1 hypothetical protein [Kitasatospora sp. RG8]TYC74269.1 hypothetical protein EH183_20230 [Streptomyces sp. CB01881]
MADNDYDPAGSTQMFRAFVDESPAPQAPGSVSTYGSTSNGSRTGLIAVIAVVALAVLGAVIWLAVK